ncbi:hypothetical protein [Rhizobium laguerreae]|uniref:hypothetical protein n=1 Tax=Rhizobium laguerreae TaxID=1076926 RepID=UPI001441D2A7|nr:hypothetical protein [Rhizobium laguerreae]NKN08941.1 hypothetical protein [Rhizobium laguerreae]
MSAEILPTSSSSPPALRGPGKTGTAMSGRRQRGCQDDPALIVGLALAFTRQGYDDVAAIPSVLVDRLFHQACSGDPTCRLVLDWLTEKANTRHGRDVSGRRHAAVPRIGPAEIVSASSASAMEEK